MIYLWKQTSGARCLWTCAVHVQLLPTNCCCSSSKLPLRPSRARTKPCCATCQRWATFYPSCRPQKCALRLPSVQETRDREGFLEKKKEKSLPAQLSPRLQLPAESLWLDVKFLSCVAVCSSRRSARFLLLLFFFKLSYSCLQPFVGRSGGRRQYVWHGIRVSSSEKRACSAKCSFFGEERRFSLLRWLGGGQTLPQVSVLSTEANATDDEVRVRNIWTFANFLRAVLSGLFCLTLSGQSDFSRRAGKETNSGFFFFFKK